MRDLDELLDPVVSRQASAAARTPDFAAVERRGQQRRRRARAAAVGAVVAVAAVVSVVGTQVASYRSDTAPAGTIQWDGPNGELAHAVESGNADNQNVAVTGDGSMLSTWSHFTRKIRPDFGASVKGFSLTTRGQTFWSPLDYASVDDVYPLVSDAFVVGVLEKRSAPISYFVADPTGIRPLEATEERADVAGSSYEGSVWMIDPSFRRWGIYAVDVESATAAPVSQLSGISADSNDAYQLPQTEGGELWVVDAGPNGRRGWSTWHPTSTANFTHRRT